MKEVFLTTVDINETRVDPVFPSEANNYVQILGAQSFSVNLEFVTSGLPISKEDFYSFILDKIGTPGTLLKIKTHNDDSR